MNQASLPFDERTTDSQTPGSQATGSQTPGSRITNSRIAEPPITDPRITERQITGPRKSENPNPESLLLVRHPRARRYVIRVRDDGRVRVTIPRRGSKRGAVEFVERERQWIENQLRQLADRRAQRAAVALPPAERAATRARASIELPARLRELAAEHGLTVRAISIRNQRWRWGSCSRTGRICLNWRLVLMPDSVRDYVIVHELMHLKRMDHSPRFWKLVEKACPTYRESRAWLREHADLLG